jgi:hypothetical protein
MLLGIWPSRDATPADSDVRCSMMQGVWPSRDETPRPTSEARCGSASEHREGRVWISCSEIHLVRVQKSIFLSTRECIKLGCSVHRLHSKYPTSLLFWWNMHMHAWSSKAYMRVCQQWLDMGLQPRLWAIKFSPYSCWKKYYFGGVTEVEKRRSPHVHCCTVHMHLSSILFFTKVSDIISSSDLQVFFSGNMKCILLSHM